MPMIGRARLLRMWGGIMDMSMDGSPIIDRTHIDGLYFNGGWCYGGFKATPASGFALRICWPKTNRTKPPQPIDLTGSKTGRMIDEKGMGNQPNCIEGTRHDYQSPPPWPPRQRRIHLSGRRALIDRPDPAAETAGRISTTTRYLRDNPRAVTASCGSTKAATALAGCHPQHLTHEIQTFELARDVARAQGRSK